MPELNENTASKDPFRQFRMWYDDHLSSNPRIPGVVFLATTSEEHRVGLRTVLLKDYDDLGFVFFTNYNSKKAMDLQSNFSAALLFYWPEKDRQVRIEGFAEKVSPEISDQYFRTRPRESQISAWASAQSSVIPDREHLEKEYLHFKNLFSGREVPRPWHWGGFRVVPDYFEFWHDREYRLHDRIIYQKNSTSWNISRLAP